MYNNKIYSADYSSETSSYNSDNIYNNDWTYPSFNFRYVPCSTLFDEIENDSRADYSTSEMATNQIKLQDYGPQPVVVNIDKVTKQNNNFRIALWTGEHYQVTLMSINVGDDIGLEIHPDTDQFIRIEEGQAVVKMGNSKDNLEFQANARDDFAIMIPAGTWHNIINTGNKPLKVYSIYAPPHHPHGVVQETKPTE
ncbi:mannose-6-phosphate isomerase-like protein (cupin superfamily) [Clostridium saccharoperbutylacetonicum]|jgi:mannose-6-phosphate isomerase-like protein (cupin superfamily)|uniref:Mannose-6-phosphate isomerase n=1 Tax=Clostridium saccharoperbutylacetonicum N1-4(HMT) TaxID=931276 RepID=M1N475_9CLOT|nr:cupin domain-containing protein [Clostridium saccharoperbutylacetonicum]AGF58237.1 mannose-6-phosphate isomerase [Clostridium saccharoperbutylacetonicum N1-4(HMT)]NRT60986.1 mannose-6-phosphate isomerase-like protein (cupin superfamily) [Clostridium saccharoperbutylacetonicum]NSB24300.1 mannose-6-phosphate isomerase-like protein (cupin superfamily) [Clostridium saccharoperbutylacetonicum]NSB43677.1 mannose-6-phosphate isomerase-like protein (cupin superfamily) [Clostridium saccharoperbutylac